MSAYEHPELHENFLGKTSKVNELAQMVESILKDDKTIPVPDHSTKVTDTSFAVMEPSQFVPLPTTRKISKRLRKPGANVKQISFMRQIDVSKEVREEARNDRLIIASSFRRMGNWEYRLYNFDKAIDYYTKGLSYISDTPVLYLNRCLCYVKKRAFKRALFDVEHVLNHIDGRNLLAWLYKAGIYKRLNDEKGCSECINNARQFNSLREAYISNFLSKMPNDF